LAYFFFRGASSSSGTTSEPAGTTPPPTMSAPAPLGVRVREVGEVGEVGATSTSGARFTRCVRNRPPNEKPVRTLSDRPVAEVPAGDCLDGCSEEGLCAGLKGTLKACVSPKGFDEKPAPVSAAAVDSSVFDFYNCK